MNEIVIKFSKEKIKLFTDNLCSIFLIVLFSFISITFIYNFIASFIYLSFKTLSNGIGHYDMMIISILILQISFMLIPLHTTGKIHLKFLKKPFTSNTTPISTHIFSLVIFILNTLALIIFYNTLDYIIFMIFVSSICLVTVVISTSIVLGCCYVDGYEFELDKEYFKKLLNL